MQAEESLEFCEYGPLLMFRTVIPHFGKIIAGYLPV